MLVHFPPERPGNVHCLQLSQPRKQILTVDDYEGLPRLPTHIHKIVMSIPIEDKATCFIPQVSAIPTHEVAIQYLESICCVVHTSPKPSVRLVSRSALLTIRPRIGVPLVLLILRVKHRHCLAVWGCWWGHYLCMCCLQGLASWYCWSRPHIRLIIALYWRCSIVTKCSIIHCSIACCSFFHYFILQQVLLSGVQLLHFCSFILLYF